MSATRRKATTSRLSGRFPGDTKTLRFCLPTSVTHLAPGCVQPPFSGGGLVVGAGHCLQCCHRQRSAGIDRASGELVCPSFDAALSAVGAAASVVVSGRSGPALADEARPPGWMERRGELVSG